MPHGLVNDSDGLGRRPRTESPKFSAIGSLTVAAAFQPIQRFQRAAEVATIHRKSVGPRLGQSICSSHFCGIKDRGQRVLNLTERKHLGQKTTKMVPPTSTNATTTWTTQTQRRHPATGNVASRAGQFDAGQISGRNTLLWGQRTHRNPIWIFGQRQQVNVTSRTVASATSSPGSYPADVTWPVFFNLEGQYAAPASIVSSARKNPWGAPLDAINSARLGEVHLEAISNLQPNQHHTDRGGPARRRWSGRIGENPDRPQTTAGLE